MLLLTISEIGNCSSSLSDTVMNDYLSAVKVGLVYMCLTFFTCLFHSLSSLFFP